MPHHTFHDLTR